MIKSEDPDRTYEYVYGEASWTCKKSHGLNLTKKLQNIFKNLSLEEIEDLYSLKSLHEKIQKLEGLLVEDFNITEEKKPKQSL
jgi:hypothetical protein